VNLNLRLRRSPGSARSPSDKVRLGEDKALRGVEVKMECGARRKVEVRLTAFEYKFEFCY
jgi:hypothetical protein